MAKPRKKKSKPITPRVCENTETGLLEVNGPKSTVKRIADMFRGHMKRHELTAYKLAKDSGLSRDAVLRLTRGYDSDERVTDPNRPGRVRLESFLSILHAAGLDLQIVIRKPELGN